MIGTPLLAWIALIAWAFASPVGSSPDDDFHLPSIWCGLAERPGLCEAVDDTPARSVPTAVLSAPCFAFHPDIDAGCWDPGVAGMSVAERANADGLYPPLFYAAMSVFAGTDVQSSVLLIRTANVTFAIGLLTSVFWALPRGLRPALLVSVLVTSVPLGMFLLASTNPSSWAILSAATVWICLYGSFVAQGRRQLVLSGLAVLGALIGAGARADAAVFAIYAVAVALLLGLRDARRALVPLLSAAAVVVVSAAFYVGARQGGAAWSGLDPSTGALTFAQHLSNLFEIPALWTGALGQANLGWFDTYLPAAVWVPTTAVFAGAIFVGIRGAAGRRAIAVAAALLAMWVVPFVMLAQSNAMVGTTVQPRYLLPLLVIAAGVGSLRIDAERAWDGIRFGLAATCLTVSITIALHQNIRRYTSGADDEAIDPGQDAQWWWVGAPSPAVVWIVGSVAFAGMLALVWVTKARTMPREASAAPRSASRPAIP